MLFAYIDHMLAASQRTSLVSRTILLLGIGLVLPCWPGLSGVALAKARSHPGLIETPTGPIAPPVWINHDAINPLPPAASEDQLRFLPVFAFTDGTCLPASTFNSEGELGGGLKASGKMDGECLGYDAANIYVQTAQVGEQKVYLYALYYPKDGSMPNSVGGHRHDWEHVLIWTKDGVASDVTFSQHSGWYTLNREKIRWEDTHAVVYVGKAKHGMYHGPNNGPGGISEGLCYFCDTRTDPGLRWFAPHRLVAFESMTPRQQELLQADIWGSANSPFRTDLFPARPLAIAAGELCHDRGCSCDLEKGSCPGFP